LLLPQHRAVDRGKLTDAATRFNKQEAHGSCVRSMFRSPAFPR
jgi:hypothetical protein